MATRTGRKVASQARLSALKKGYPTTGGMIPADKKGRPMLRTKGKPSGINTDPLQIQEKDRTKRIPEVGLSRRRR